MATRIRFSIFAIAREHSVSHFWGLVKDAISYSPVSFLPSAEEGRDSRSSKSAISFSPACASCGVGSVQNFRLCRRMLLIPRVVEARQKYLVPVPPRSREWACHGKKKHFLRCMRLVGYFFEGQTPKEQKKHKKSYCTRQHYCCWGSGYKVTTRSFLTHLLKLCKRANRFLLGTVGGSPFILDFSVVVFSAFS